MGYRFATGKTGCVDSQKKDEMYVQEDEDTHKQVGVTTAKKVD